MHKEVLSGINNISIYPVISVVVFFLFFSIMGIWILKSKKEDFDAVSKIPLNDNQNQ
ncbi:MAG: cbb3-type cytochrome c oxidase subunit 3 [Bacteroidia bacterium]|nr:cbb3-type cytochrome c oxidase subunit 3 [Bacteroidia bacterium]